MARASFHNRYETFSRERLERLIDRRPGVAEALGNALLRRKAFLIAVSHGGQHVVDGNADGAHGPGVKPDHIGVIQTTRRQ